MAVSPVGFTWSLEISYTHTQLVQPLWRTVHRFVKKCHLELPCDAGRMPLLGMYAEKVKTLIRNDTCPLIFIVHWCYWQQPRHGQPPSVHPQKNGWRRRGPCIRRNITQPRKGMKSCQLQHVDGLGGHHSKWSKSKTSIMWHHLWKGKSLSRIWRFVAPQGLYSPWNSPGQDTGVGSLSLLQGIFPTQGSDPGLLYGRWILLPAEPARKPKNTGVGSLSLLQGIFPTQELDWGLLHGRLPLYQLNYEGRPRYDLRVESKPTR